MKNLHVLYILSEWVDLTVLFPVHLIIVGSILPLNILYILRKEVYLWIKFVPHLHIQMGTIVS